MKKDYHYHDHHGERRRLQTTTALKLRPFVLRPRRVKLNVFPSSRHPKNPEQPTPKSPYWGTHLCAYDRTQYADSGQLQILLRRLRFKVWGFWLLLPRSEAARLKNAVSRVWHVDDISPAAGFAMEADVQGRRRPQESEFTAVFFHWLVVVNTRC